MLILSMLIGVTWGLLVQVVHGHERRRLLLL
jgi:hypothetical protein